MNLTPLLVGFINGIGQKVKSLLPRSRKHCVTFAPAAEGGINQKLAAVAAKLDEAKAFAKAKGTDRAYSEISKC